MSSNNKVRANSVETQATQPEHQQPEWTKAFTRIVGENGDGYDDDDNNQAATTTKAAATKKASATVRKRKQADSLQQQQQQAAAPSSDLSDLDDHNEDDLNDDPDYAIQIVPRPGDAPFDQAELIYAQNFGTYFTRNALRDRVMPIVEGDSVVSLRDLTWAATNYFPQSRTTTVDPFTGYEIRLDHAYNMYLDEYKKYRFDSFRRVYEDQSRIIIVVCADDAEFVFQTTFAQLSFFRFALTYRFIENVEEKIGDIKQHWAIVNDRRKKEKQSGATANKSKRAPLTQKMPETMEITRGRFEIRY